MILVVLLFLFYLSIPLCVRLVGGQSCSSAVIQQCAAGFSNRRSAADRSVAAQHTEKLALLMRIQCMMPVPP